MSVYCLHKVLVRLFEKPFLNPITLIYAEMQLHKNVVKDVFLHDDLPIAITFSSDGL